MRRKYGKAAGTSYENKLWESYHSAADYRFVGKRGRKYISAYRKRYGRWGTKWM